VGKKLYVGNLSFLMTDSDLHNLFEGHGRVQSAWVLTDPHTGRSKGFGFVEMGSGEQAQASVAALNGKEVNGRALAVSETRPLEEPGASQRGLAGGNVRGVFGDRRSY
jgi:cold-inducible RNA-binding protein